MTEVQSGPGQNEPEQNGAEAGRGRRRSSVPRNVAWLAGIVAVALGATTLWSGLRTADSSSSATIAVTEASPSPSVSPSPSASPTPPEPSAAPYSLTTLARPAIDEILPRTLPVAKIDTLSGLPGMVAVPRSPRIPAYARPDVTKAPVLALESEYYDADARWLVLERRQGWVRVLVPYGRGALPSDAPERVNGVSAWLRAKAVRLEPEQRSVVVDLSDRTLTLTHADGTSDQVPAAVGAPATPTPQGLTQVFTVTEAVNTGPSVFLSMQSESLDGFYGTAYAATAIHVGVGQGQAVSNGCVRLTSADYQRLTDLDPGVPVLIRA